jgi:hypothetical protein
MSTRHTFLADILVNAVEGGINYWAETKNYHWSKRDEDGEISSEYADDVYVDIREKDYATEKEETPWFRVKAESLERGIEKIKDPNFQINPQIAKQVLYSDHFSDAGDIDTEIADVIVQATMFGEIVYG